jgi:hypothetical protein
MKKFLCGVANLFFYSSTEDLIFQSKTMISDAIEITVENTPITGGQGNAQQFIYYHSSKMNITAEDIQWNLSYLAAQLGTSVVTSTNVYFEENITLGAAAAGTVTNTPVSALGSATIYGWVTHSDGQSEKVQFSTKTFTSALGAENDVVCVRYYMANTAAQSVEIPANIVPSSGRLVLEANLYSSESGAVDGSTLIGKCQFIIPSAQLTGQVNVNLSSSGVSNTPLNFVALASTVAGCTAAGIYGYIKEVITTSHWYDNCYAICLIDDTIPLTAATSPKTLVVYAIPSSGSAFIAPNADLDFVSGTPATATAGLHTGIITFAQAGSTIISIAITAKPTVTTQCTISAT